MNDNELVLSDEEHTYWECAVRGDQGGDAPSAIERGRAIRANYIDRAKRMAKALRKQVTISSPEGHVLFRTGGRR